MTLGGDAGLLGVAELGLGELALLDFLEAKLDGAVAVVLLGLLLSDDAGTRFDNGHGNDLAALIEDLGHAHFFADDCFLHVLFSFLGYWLTGLAIGEPACQHDPSVLVTDCGGRCII